MALPLPVPDPPGKAGPGWARRGHAEPHVVLPCSAPRQLRAVIGQRGRPGPAQGAAQAGAQRAGRAQEASPGRGARAHLRGVPAGLLPAGAAAWPTPGQHVLCCWAQLGCCLQPAVGRSRVGATPAAPHPQTTSPLGGSAWADSGKLTALACAAPWSLPLMARARAAGQGR